MAEQNLKLTINTDDDIIHLMGDDHIGSNFETPLRADAFKLDDNLKIELIEKHFREIMNILGLDLSDDRIRLPTKRMQRPWHAPACRQACAVRGNR